MSEHAPETPGMTEAQDAALRDLCARYGVDFAPSHYTPKFDLPPNWVAGWVGGPRHANPSYANPEQPAGAPTLFVGVSPGGEVSS